MNQLQHNKSKGLPIFPVFLIFLGVGLLLNRLSFLQYNWKTIFWICLCAVSLVGLIQALYLHKRNSVFWSSFIFFLSAVIVIHRLQILDLDFWNFPATASLILGLSFLVLYLSEPKMFGNFILFLLFGSYGILYYLWWWNIIYWYDFKHLLKTYWPVLIILWGISLMFRRSKNFC